MNLIASFVQPYLAFILGAAYNLQQTLEGLRVHGSNYLVRNAAGQIVDSYWNASQAVALPLLGVLAFSCVLLGLFLVALRSLAGWRGVWIAVAVLGLPGLLSALGWWPEIHWLPRSYNVGSGVLGSPWGMFALLAISLSSGWTAVILATKTFALDDRFRHGYDQFWYAMAISAGLFFVTDLDATQTREQLRDSAATSQAASAYLLKQVQRLESECDSGQVALPTACQWAHRSQWSLAQYAHYGDKLYAQFGPDDASVIYGEDRAKPDAAAMQKLRQELHEYNLLRCPVRKISEGVRQYSPTSRTCEAPPASYCVAYPDVPLSGVEPQEAPMKTVAIANECVVPTLIALKAEQARLEPEVSANTRNRHLRWLFFLCTAIVAGGKVANASARLALAVQQARKATVKTEQQEAEAQTRPAGPRTARVGLLARGPRRVRPPSRGA